MLNRVKHLALEKEVTNDTYFTFAGQILRFTPKKLNLSTGGSLKRKLGDGLVQVYHPHPEKNRMRLPPIILRFQVSFTYILKIRFGAQDDKIQ